MPLSGKDPPCATSTSRDAAEPVLGSEVLNFAATDADGMSDETSSLSRTLRSACIRDAHTPCKSDLTVS